MKKILIAGAGQIGSRHLQGLMKLNFPTEVFVVDPSLKSLELSKSRLKEVKNIHPLINVSFFSILPNLGKIDLAIIATTSDIRKKVILDILRENQVKNFLLEKLAFQNISDFKEIMKIFKKNNSKSWVNCPNRLFKSYINIKLNIGEKDKLTMNVSGGKWNLASNTIHYLDLFHFLTSCKKIKIINSDLKNQIFKSKREKFIELGGSITFISEKGDKLNVFDSMRDDSPVKVNINSSKESITINENEETAEYIDLVTNSVKEKNNFELTKQSSLTTKIASDIILNDKCGLLKIDDSFIIHKILLDFFLLRIKLITKKEYSSCPIT